MTVYNINLGIGWASSGVEYAQAYRAKVFRELNVPVKFIFTDMFQSENLQHFTSNIGFKDDEILWLYTYFTDIKIASTCYTRKQLEATFTSPIKKVEMGYKLIRYYFDDQNMYINASLCGEADQYVQRVEYVVQGNLCRKDYYSYTKIFSEYYAQKGEKIQLYQRSFFNEDGRVAYEEIVQGKESIFCFPRRICTSKAELIAYMLEEMKLTNKDVILLDRSTGIGQAVFQSKGEAKLAVVVHAEHFNVNGTDKDHVLWNNYYEYQFTNADKVDAFITSTEKQKEVLAQQFKQYTPFVPKIYAIPVGSLEKLRYPNKQRKPYAMLTGSRLASEKHIDWLVEAVVIAHNEIPELIFDIYGEGGERQKLIDLIDEHQARDYIQLKGHQNLTDIYKDYELYLTASTSEGFGLTLMEAVGSGLPLIGLNVPYGNQTFVEDEKNGYLIERQENDQRSVMAMLFAEKIIQYYRVLNQEDAYVKSYQIAEKFLYRHLSRMWQTFVKEICHD